MEKLVDIVDEGDTSLLVPLSWLTIEVTSVSAQRMKKTHRIAPH